MLTKYKEVRPKKGVNKPFDVFMSGAYSEVFSGKGHPISTYFKISFSPKLF